MDVLLISSITVAFSDCTTRSCSVSLAFDRIFFSCWLIWATYFIAAFSYPCQPHQWQSLHLSEYRFWPEWYVHFAWPSLPFLHITKWSPKKIKEQYPGSLRSSLTPCSGSCVLFSLHPSAPPDQPDSSLPSSDSWLSASQNENKDRVQPSFCSSAYLQIKIGYICENPWPDSAQWVFLTLQQFKTQCKSIDSVRSQSYSNTISPKTLV